MSKVVTPKVSVRARAAPAAAHPNHVLSRLPRYLLQLEGAALFGAALAVYIDADYSVLALALLFLAPDLSFAAYAGGPRVGAAIYNALHTLLWPSVIVAIGIVADEPTLIQVSLIWLAHIGLDRGLGFGLKYPTAFKDTHLRKV
jgi:hypothetical protein